MTPQLFLQVFLHLLPSLVLLACAFLSRRDPRVRERWVNLLFSIGNIRANQKDDPKVQESVKLPFFILAGLFLIWPIWYLWHDSYAQMRPEVNPLPTPLPKPTPTPNAQVNAVPTPTPTIVPVAPPPLPGQPGQAAPPPAVSAPPMAAIPTPITANPAAPTAPATGQAMPTPMQIR